MEMTAPSGLASRIIFMRYSLPSVELVHIDDKSLVSSQDLLM